MIYKLLPIAVQGDPQIIACFDDDGKCRLTCTEQNEDYLAWLEAGNTPEAAE